MQVIGGLRSSGTSSRTFSSALTNTQFTHFGKSGSTGVDLMEDVVQAYYQLNFVSRVGPEPALYRGVSVTPIVATDVGDVAPVRAPCHMPLSYL